MITRTVINGNLFAGTMTINQTQRMEQIQQFIQNNLKDAATAPFKKSPPLAETPLLDYDLQELRFGLPVVRGKNTCSVEASTGDTPRRLFINPNFSFPLSAELPVIKNREFVIETLLEFEGEGIIRIMIPPGYKIASYPEPDEIERIFGRFQSTILFTDEMMIYCRKIQLISGTYPSGAFHEFTDFFNKIEHNGNSSIVLVEAVQKDIVTD